MQKWPKIIFLRLLLKIIPVLWKAMFRLLLPGFAWFFVHFHKLIRPHPGPLWGGVPEVYNRKIPEFCCCAVLKSCLRIDQQYFFWETRNSKLSQRISMVSNCSKSYLFCLFPNAVCLPEILRVLCNFPFWIIFSILKHIFQHIHCLARKYSPLPAIWNMACINYNIRILSRRKQVNIQILRISQKSLQN